MVILMVNNMHSLTNLIYVTNLICEKKSKLHFEIIHITSQTTNK